MYERRILHPYMASVSLARITCGDPFHPGNGTVIAEVRAYPRWIHESGWHPDVTVEAVHFSAARHDVRRPEAGPLSHEQAIKFVGPAAEVEAMPLHGDRPLRRWEPDGDPAPRWRYSIRCSCGKELVTRDMLGLILAVSDTRDLPMTVPLSGLIRYASNRK